MSAQQIVLQDWLQAPVSAGVIPESQAWEIQDVSMEHSEGEWVMLPKHLHQASALIHLFHQEPLNKIPL